MRKYSFQFNQPFFIFIIFVFAGFNAACCSSPVTNDHIAIIFSGEENGYLKPCGCTEDQLGGIKRKHEAIDSLKKSSEVILPISLGDIPGYPNRQNEIKLEIMLKAMDMMDYVVHNIGEKDLAMGYEILHYFSQVSNVAFISSNVKFDNHPDINIIPYLEKNIKTKDSEINIVFLGILSPDLVEDELYNIKISDPVESLRPLIKEFNNSADLLILLSHAEEYETLEIANNLPELDLIISGHDEDDPDTFAKKVNDTLIASVGTLGKYIGIVKYFEKDNEWKILPPKDGEFLRLIPLGQQFNIPSEVDVLLSEYKTIVREENLLAKHQKILAAQGEKFTGNVTCGSCHPKIYLHWKETKHSSAYETLVKSGDQFDPECVRCHVIGLDYSTGFQSIEKTPDLKGVGCESCHGFGNTHITDTEVPYKKDYKTECIKCHDPENSPHFEYNSYWEKIRHPVKKMGPINQ